MPITVITIKNSPNSLRGDLSRWTQEIATGVYIGNFNVKVRNELWKKIKSQIGSGEATISFSYRNEIGYLFYTHNTQRSCDFFDGLPLVRYVLDDSKEKNSKLKLGFSNQSKYSKAKNFQKPRKNTHNSNYIVIDIETDGLNENVNKIIEIAAIKVCNEEIFEFQSYIFYKGKLPENIIKLTGIDQELLEKEGKPIQDVLCRFKEFIGNDILVGYNVDFDIRFINKSLSEAGLPKMINKTYDIMRFVKKEKKFLPNYKLPTVLKSYNINEEVPHNALADAKLIYTLAKKVNKFNQIFK